MNLFKKHAISLLLHSGKSLPLFASQEEAEKYYFPLKEKSINTLEDILLQHNEGGLTYTLEDLKTIERLYFQLRDEEKVSETELKKFVQSISLYGKEILVRAHNYKWFVEEEDFNPGHYVIRVRSNNGAGGVQISGTGGAPRELHQDNKRKQSIYRQYKQYSEALL